jgi:hypothetical protein
MKLLTTFTGKRQQILYCLITDLRRQRVARN